MRALRALSSPGWSERFLFLDLICRYACTCVNILLQELVSTSRDCVCWTGNAAAHAVLHGFIAVGTAVVNAIGIAIIGIAPRGLAAARASAARKWRGAPCAAFVSSVFGFVLLSAQTCTSSHVPSSCVFPPASTYSVSSDCQDTDDHWAGDIELVRDGIRGCGGCNEGHFACAVAEDAQHWVQFSFNHPITINGFQQLLFKADGRQYKHQKVSLSTTGVFAGEEIVVFSCGSYAECGVSDGATVSFDSTEVRYVRFYSGRNSVNSYTHFIEVNVCMVASDEAAGCNAGFTSNGHGGCRSTENFVVKFSDTQTWKEARQTCQKVCTGCDLAEISSPEENKQVAQAVREKCMPCYQFLRDPNDCSWSGVAWIGLHDSNKEGTFVWSQSQSKYLDGWTNPTFKPDNGWSGGEDFVALGSEGTWNDLNQAWKLACAVCQRPSNVCKTGQRFDTEPRPRCIDCPAGTHNSSHTANTCVWCEAGKFSASGQSTCAMCPAGKYSSLQGTSADDADIEVGSRVIIVGKEVNPSKDEASRRFLEPGDVGTVVEINSISLESSQGRVLTSSFLILFVSASSGVCQIRGLDGGSGFLVQPLLSMLVLASFPTGLCFSSKKRYSVAASDGTRGWFDEGSITLIVCTPCPEGTKSSKGASTCTSSAPRTPTPTSGSIAAPACQQPIESISQVGLRIIFQVLSTYSSEDFNVLRQRKFRQAIAAAASVNSTCAITEKDVNITRIIEDGADSGIGRRLLADGIAVDVSIAMISQEAGNALVQRGTLTKESINRELIKYELVPITEVSSSPVLEKREQDGSRETTSVNNSLNVGGVIASCVIFVVVVAAAVLFFRTRHRGPVHVVDAPLHVHVIGGGASRGSNGSGGGGGGGDNQFRPPPLCRSSSVKCVEDFVRARTEKARAMAVRSLDLQR